MFVFQYKVSSCSCACPETCFLDQGGLKLRSDARFCLRNSGIKGVSYFLMHTNMRICTSKWLKKLLARGCTLVAEHLTGLCNVLGSIPSITKQTNRQAGRWIPTCDCPGMNLESWDFIVKWVTHLMNLRKLMLCFSKVMAWYTLQTQSNTMFKNKILFRWVFLSVTCDIFLLWLSIFSSLFCIFTLLTMVCFCGVTFLVFSSWDSTCSLYLYGYVFL